MNSARSTTIRRLLPFALLTLSSTPLCAQTMEDGIMIPKKDLMTGFLYTHDSWDEYWEGTLSRTNGNIGTLTTQSLTFYGNYGVTDKLNVIVTLPYIWTDASQGVLHGMSGFQDVSLAAKYALLDTAFGAGSLRAVAVASAGLPISDYTPDFMPLSIGTASDRLTGRLVLRFQAKRGWFIDGSAAYTWRDNVKLDRPLYFTDDRLFLSDEVAMPDVFHYTVSAGYRKEGLLVPITFSEQVTLGGGDIRRQDMPFVSNRMNASRLDALVMYSLPKGWKDFALRVAAAYTVGGRNVGKATTFTAGVLYTFHF